LLSALRAESGGGPMAARQVVSEDVEAGFLARDLWHSDGGHDGLMRDGRQMRHAEDPTRSIEEHGFCLVTSCPTQLSLDDFTKHFVRRQLKSVMQSITFDGDSAIPGKMANYAGPIAERDESTELVAQYQRDTVSAVKRGQARVSWSRGGGRMQPGGAILGVSGAARPSVRC